MAIFTYWDRPDRSPIREFLVEWQTQFSDFRVLGDSEVEAMVLTHFPEHLELFRRIRIPTCKSDIAILLGLYCLGGLYVDCHCAPANAGAVSRLLADSGEQRGLGARSLQQGLRLRTSPGCGIASVE
jgi:hypothetical protein